MNYINPKKTLICLVIIVIGILAIQACKTHYFRSNYEDENELMHESENLQTKPFLKAHLKNGDICILKDSWQIDSSQMVVSGTGTRYNYNRSVVQEGEISIPIDSVAIFETNTKLQSPESGRITALSILAGLDLAMTIVCFTNPKTCFGSCPTFYIDDNKKFPYADAEGFSNAISPSMEYYDIDALTTKDITDNTFSLTMKNEALETHCVREVKLLASPVNEGENVHQSPADNFFLCENNYALSSSTAGEGDITTLLQQRDGKERFSLSDPDNLKSKEEIYMTFEDVDNPRDLGLLLDFRQTLMTTYFIYSAMDYMGDEVSDIFARMEENSDTRDKLKNGIKAELGDIDIYAWNAQKQAWKYQDGFYETGPIAINKKMIPLQNIGSDSTVKLKIVLNKGLWRLDYAALTNIVEKVEPHKISPSIILNKGKQDSVALGKINNPEKHLISMPGSEYKFNFDLPNKNTDYDLFLYSKGYYLEWMREKWVRDKNLRKLYQMISHPKTYLREEAKSYKKYEATMEEKFWQSRIDTENFSYYE